MSTVDGPTPAQVAEWARLADEASEAWLWHEQTDDTLAGFGFHMSQLLYRMPKDGQTRDMQEQITALVEAVAALIADRQRLADALEEAGRSREFDQAYMQGLNTRAEQAEAERDRLRTAMEELVQDCDGAIGHENVLGQQVVTVRWLRDRLRAALAAPGSDVQEAAADV